LEDDQALSLVENRQAAIHEVVQINPGLGVALAPWSGRDLQAIGIEGDSVVIGYDASVLEAELVRWITLCRPWDISRAGLSRFDLKACIELG
jgi:hypothetical protein